jgi:hypothetical protein
MYHVTQNLGLPFWHQQSERLLSRLFHDCRLALITAGSGGGALAAHKLARQFEYLYTAERRDADLRRITNFVADR